MPHNLTHTLNEKEEDIKSRVLGNTSGGPGVDSSTLEGLSARINEEIGETLTGDEFNFDEKTIRDKFEERRKLAQQGGEARRDLIESRFGTRIEEAREEGETTMTKAREGQRGFAATPRSLQMITEDTEKRVRNLKKDRDELILAGEVAEAQRLDNLITQEQAAVTNARTNFLSNLFNIAGEVRSQRSFQTPEEQTMQTLKNQYADIPGVTEAQSLDEIRQLIQPTLSDTREMQQRKAELENELLQANIDATRADSIDTEGLESQAQEVETAQNILNVINTLENHPGFGGAVGAKGLFSSFGGLKGEPIAGTPAAGFMALFDRLDALVRSPALEKLRGLGAMSNKELQFVTNTLTALDPDMPEADFKRELNRVRNTMQTVLQRAKEQGLLSSQGSNRNLTDGNVPEDTATSTSVTAENDDNIFLNQNAFLDNLNLPGN